VRNYLKKISKFKLGKHHDPGEEEKTNATTIFSRKSNIKETAGASRKAKKSKGCKETREAKGADRKKSFHSPWKIVKTSTKEIEERGEKTRKMGNG